MCGNLEEYISATAKVSKSQSKDHEKILKVRITICAESPLSMPMGLTLFFGNRLSVIR